MIDSAATRRKNVRELIGLVQPETRFLDMAMHIRRPMAIFTTGIKSGTIVDGRTGDGPTVGMTVLADASPGVPVPVAGLVRGESRSLRDHDLIILDGAPVGEYRPTLLLSAGGRWDFLTRDWSSDSPTDIMIFDVTEAQVDHVRWIAGWMRRYKARQLDPRLRLGTPDPEYDFSVLMSLSGRRAGKTTISTILTWAFAIDMPKFGNSNTIAWMVSCAFSERDELDRETKEWIPERWYSYREWPMHSYSLRHGSVVFNVSADNADTLKRGRCDWILINELAKMDRLVLSNAVGAVSDRGGLVWGTTNPPRRQKGAFVKTIHDRFEEARALHQAYPIKVMKMDHKQNTAIDQRARTSVGLAIAELDPKLAAADDEGLVLSIDDLIFYEYDQIRHGLAAMPTDLPDITEQMTKKLYNRSFEILAGVDFQDRPYINAVFAKVLGTMENPILWIVGEYFLKGSETEFIEGVGDQGFYIGPRTLQEVTPHNVLWVGDSSAQWQNKKERNAATRKDPPSFIFFKNAGCHIVPPTVKIRPESRYSANPPHEISYAQCNAWFKTDRIHIAPHLKKAREACKECAAKRIGKEVLAVGEHAHWIDVIRYLAWYLDPPLTRRAKGGAGAVPMQAYTV